MAFCPQCGAGIAEGARYCSACGSSLAGSGLPPAPAGPAPQAARRDTGLAELLILVGAVLSLVVPVLLAAVFFGLGATFWFVPFASMPGAVMGLIAVAFLVLGLVWMLLALFARSLIRQGDLEKGGVVAVVVGVLMILTGGLVSGLLVVVGGILAWTAR